MAIHIAQIGKHKFVCGLFWQSLSRPRELVKEATDLAKKIDFDLMVLRTDQSTAQAGFAQTKEGVKRGMFSLGAIVSKTLAIEGAYYDGEQQPAHNWLAALKLPDGMWAYFAVRDANFLPNGDFAGTKEEVMERLLGDYGLGGWNVVIGDEELSEYGFHNFNARRIESLIPHRKDGSVRVHRWWGMRQLNVKTDWRPYALAASVVAVSVGGAVYWKYQERLKEEARMEQAIAAARAALLSQKKNVPAEIARPWAVMASPRATTRACIQNFTHLTPGGWRLDEYACTPSEVTYAWSRQYSTVSYLLAQVPGANVDLNGDKAVWARPIESAQNHTENLLPSKEVLEPMLSRLQLMGVETRFTRNPVPSPKDGEPAPTWQQYTFVMQTRNASPDNVALVLERPGVQINRLKYSSSGWSIEGVMYAN